MFDQKDPIRTLTRLAKKYRNARLIKKERLVKIRRQREAIDVVRGGCSHLATNITYLGARGAARKYRSAKALFARVKSLLSEFGDGMVTAGEVDRLVKGKRYRRTVSRGKTLYSFDAKAVTDFRVSFQSDGSRPRIEISYYMN